MIPATLQIKSENLLKEFRSRVPDDKELHLLIDLVKMEEFSRMITYKEFPRRLEYKFGYFAIDEHERDLFFDKFNTFTQFYEKEKRIKKLSPLQILQILRAEGFIIPESRILRYYNPVKLQMELDKKFNKQYKLRYGNRNRSSFNEGIRA